MFGMSRTCKASYVSILKLHYRIGVMGVLDVYLRPMIVAFWFIETLSTHTRYSTPFLFLVLNDVCEGIIEKTE
jgi:hypothetical protein